jgi:hypothetical protein
VPLDLTVSAESLFFAADLTREPEAAFPRRHRPVRRIDALINVAADNDAGVLEAHADRLHANLDANLAHLALLQPPA